MAERDRYKLMSHPLSESLIMRKFYRFGFALFLTSFLLYAVFLGLFTTTVLLTKHPQHYYNITDLDFDTNSCQSVIAALNMTSLKTADDTRLQIAMYVLLAINAFKNLTAIILYARTAPKKLFTFILEITSLALSFFFTLDASYQLKHAMRCPIQWQIGAVGLFMGYIALFYYIQYVPIFGIYVLMIRKIFIRFTLFIPVFMVLISAFALSFHMIFQNFDSFEDVSISLAKIRTYGFLVSSL